MIEQYTITTTPRYNFPQPTPSLPIPQRFTELSINSLRQFRTNNLKPNSQDPLQKCLDSPTAELQIKRQPLTISPNREETTVSAVDTSTIKIGETSKGIIVAIRGATVKKHNRNYHYQRLGPFIFHLTEENKNAVYNNLERDCFNNQINTHQSAPTLLQMPIRLASLLERWLQTNIARMVSHGLILFDGSLASGTMDTSVQRMREILILSRRSGNVVLAFSKATNLRSNGFLITDLLPAKEPPYLLETSGLLFKPPILLQGNVYVARLSKANFAFRLDVDREVPFQSQIEAIEKLIGNDVLQQSYPETLRLAHILCTFTANEVLAMQHFTTRKHGLQLINRPDMHRLLFGPFGRECFN